MVSIFSKRISKLGECPVWSVQHNALFWVDIIDHKMHCESWCGGHTEWQLDESCSAMAVVDKTRLLVVGEAGVHILNLDIGSLTNVAKIENDGNKYRTNDGAADGYGRFWFGTMDREARNPGGKIYSYHPSEGLRIVMTNVGIPNTFTWSPDHKYMYIGDSMWQQISIFNYDMNSGRLGKKAKFIDLAGSKDVPDGSAMDSEGFLWNAHWNGAKVVRYSKKGKINSELQLPVPRPTSCTFGGPDGKYLFITSAREGLSSSELKEFPLSGSVFYVETEVQGVINHQASI